MTARIRQILPASRLPLLLLAGFLALLPGRSPASVCDDLLAVQQRSAGRPSPESQDRIAYLQRLLDRKTIEIERAIAAAAPIPEQVGRGDGGPKGPCEDLLTVHRAKLNDALKKFNEERACLSTSHPSIPSDIIRIVRAMNNVRCGTDGNPSAVVAKSPFPVISPPSTPGPVAGTPSKFPESRPPAPPPPASPSLPGQCSGLAPTGNQTRVPFVLGMSHQRATMEMRLVGLKSFPYEHQKAENPKENGQVMGTSPVACAVVPLGSTVDIAYKADYVAPQGTAAQSSTPDR